MSEAILNAVPDLPMPHIDEKGFYQTPNVMSIKAIRAKLTGADWALWEYFKMFDPHGDKMVDLPSVQEISQAVGISIRQFKRSLKKLEELGLYDSEPVKIRGQNLAGKLAKQVCQEKKQLKSSGKNKMTDLPTTGQDRRVDDESAELMPDLPTTGQGCPNQPPEPLPQADFKTPQTIQTSSDLIQTTTNTDDVAAAEKEIATEPNSQKEQPTEEEVKTALQKVADLSPEIKISAAVKKYVITYWANFPLALKTTKEALKDGSLKNPTGFFMDGLKNPVEPPKVTAKTTTAVKKEWKWNDDWTQHPEYEELLHDAYRGRWNWVVEAIPRAERTKRGFFMQWCESNDAFSVFEEDVP